MYPYGHCKLASPPVNKRIVRASAARMSNDACRTELNRLPLRGKILSLAFNYWQHLWSSSNSLVSKIVDVTRSHNSTVGLFKLVVYF